MRSHLHVSSCTEVARARTHTLRHSFRHLLPLFSEDGGMLLCLGTSHRLPDERFIPMSLNCAGQGSQEAEEGSREAQA